MRAASLALALALALGAAPAGAAEKLVSSLSSHQVLITPSFTGTKLVLFGIVERDGDTPVRNGYDIVATISGPRETLSSIGRFDSTVR